MKKPNTGIKAVLAVFLMIFGVAQQGEAQLQNNESSTHYLSLQIAASAGASSENYQGYAEKLARTISHLDTDQQATIFGFMPTPSGSIQAAPDSSSSQLPANSGNATNSIPVTVGSTPQDPTERSPHPSSWWQDILASIRGYFLAGDGNPGQG